MPIYEFYCKKCQTVTEALLAKPEDYSVCSNCGYPAERQISLSSFQFKGSGFYTTDYKRYFKGKRKKWA